MGNNGLPFKSVIALSSEEIDVIFELELENEVLVDSIRVGWRADRIAKKREAGQRKIILQQTPSIQCTATQFSLT